MLIEEQERLALPEPLQPAAGVALNPELLVQARNRGVGLTTILEELDPSPTDSPLDAFERQLVLAGIRLHGTDADTIDRFFVSSESAVLFPEYVSRSIRAGMQEFEPLNQITAARTRIKADTYRALYMDDSVLTAEDLRLARVGEGAELPRLELKTGEHTVPIHKYGRYLEVTYEALRRKTADVVAVFLRAVGYQVQRDKFAAAVEVLLSGDGNSNAAPTLNTAVDGTLAYADLVEFDLLFQPYELNVLLGNRNTMKTLLTLDEFKDPAVGVRFQNKGQLITPFGARLIVSSAVPDGLLIGLDRRYALEEIYETGLMVESDRLVRQQLEGTAITDTAGFAKVIQAASRVLQIDW